MQGRKPLPLERVLLEDLHGHCRAALGDCQRIHQRELRKAKVFVDLAKGVLTESDFKVRVKSLENAHAQHMDAGVVVFNDLLQYLNPEIVAKADEKVHASMRSAEMIFAEMWSNPDVLGGLLDVLATHLEGWNLRVEMLQDLLNRLGEAIQSGDESVDTRVDTQGKSPHYSPRNPEIVPLYLFIEAKRGTGKSDNELIHEFMERGVRTTFGALRRGLTRYRDSLRPPDVRD